MNTVDVICTIPSDQEPPCTEQETCVFHFDDQSDSTPMNYCWITYGQRDKGTGMENKKCAFYG